MMSGKFQRVLLAATAAVAVSASTAWADDDGDDNKVELSSGQLAELQKIAAKRGLFEVQPLAVALLSRDLVACIDSALRADAVRSLHGNHRKKINAYALFGQLD